MKKLLHEYKMKKLTLFLLLVVPGSIAVLASTWWGVNDFMALVYPFKDKQ
jgi:hypothetical protein